MVCMYFHNALSEKNKYKSCRFLNRFEIRVFLEISLKSNALKYRNIQCTTNLIIAFYQINSN